MERNNVKQYLLLAISLLITFIILSNVLRDLRSESAGNYKSESYVEEFLEGSVLVWDREIYYTLEDILIDFISSYNSRDEYKAHVPYQDYYSALSQSYANFLSVKEYLYISEDFLQDFYITENLGTNSELRFKNLIKSIYVKDNTKYMCIVKNDNMQDDRYIGIELDKSRKMFNIFYIK